MLAFVLLLFPTGHVRSRRWRLAGWFIGVVFTLATVWALIAATSQWARPFTSPFSQPGSPAGSPVPYLMTAFLISAALLVSVAAVVVRFAKSLGEERLQLKWCAMAALVLVVVFVASIWVNSAIVNVLQSLAFVGLWTAIAIAVLKYRLYDIDRLISRTLAYAIVTGVLAGRVRGPGAAGHPGAHAQVASCRGCVHAGSRRAVQLAAVAGAAGGGPAVQPGPL